MKFPWGRRSEPAAEMVSPTPAAGTELATLEQILVIQNPSSRLGHELRHFLDMLHYNVQKVEVVKAMSEGYQRLERERYIFACVELTVSSENDGIELFKKFKNDYRFSRKNEHMPLLLLPPYGRLDEPEEVLALLKNGEVTVKAIYRKILPQLFYKLMMERTV